MVNGTDCSYQEVIVSFYQSLVITITGLATERYLQKCACKKIHVAACSVEQMQEAETMKSMCAACLIISSCQLVYMKNLHILELNSEYSSESGTALKLSLHICVKDFKNFHSVINFIWH